MLSTLGGVRDMKVDNVSNKFCNIFEPEFGLNVYVLMMKQTIDHKLEQANVV